MSEPVWTVLQGWAESSRAGCWLYRPRDLEEVASALEDARSRRLTVVHRGAGLSYGDAALNEGGAVVETTALRRVLELDAVAGTMRAEAGATVEDVWRAAVPHGWWPAVVPGSMRATLAGCVAMDVHGKNHRQRGSFGDHVLGVTLLEPGSGPARLDAARDAERMSQVIGAQGLTGTVLDVTLQLERVASGYLEVETRAAGSLEETLERLEREGDRADHAVAWLDCTPLGRGRSVLHFSRHLPPDHRLAGAGLSVADQMLPERLAGVLPRRWAASLLAPLTSDRGVRLVNRSRHLYGRLRSGRRHLESHAAFHFLLDHVPAWKRVYQPHGFLQYQLFVPGASALHAFREALRLQRDTGAFAYLGVLKRHREGRFAAPYALDGFSLALDLPVRPERAGALAELCRSLDALLREVGGRVYAAKDAVSTGRLPRVRNPAFSSDLVRRWERGPGKPGALVARWGPDARRREPPG